MTRREWLAANPPPRPGKSIQQLLEGLNAQNAKRAELVQLRQRWEQHKAFWLTHILPPGSPQTTDSQYAQGQVSEATANIAEADKQLATSQDVPGRILQLQEELKKSARCPVHHNDLFRNLNRPEDMFTCESGPHQLFWTRVNGAPALVSLDTLNLPGLDYAMTDGTAITRAQWLASHPPVLACPVHPKEQLVHQPDDRIDVFRCTKSDAMFLWTAKPNGVAVMTAWPAKNPLPSLEEPV